MIVIVYGWKIKIIRVISLSMRRMRVRIIVRIMIGITGNITRRVLVYLTFSRSKVIVLVAASKELSLNFRRVAHLQI